MRLETFGQNEHWLNVTNGSVCFSYDSPVACYVGNTYYVSDEYAKRSGTTGKHVNHFTGKKHTVISKELFAEKLQAVFIGFKH